MRPVLTRSLTSVVAIAVAASALFAVPAFAQEADPISDACVEPEASSAPVTEVTLSIPEDFRIALFDGVWEGIRDFYIDPATNGLDWESVGDEYAPLVIQTDNAHEVYEILREMVELLDDPYTNFYAPEDLGDPETFDPSYGGIGALLDTSAAGEGSDGLRILYVFEGGSAKDSGIRARDRIVGVEGDACARIADIRGPEGTPVTLSVVSPGEPARDITLDRRRINPVISPDARRLDSAPGMGYVRLLSLSGQHTIDGVEQALTTLAREPLDGLIIDLRSSNEGRPRVVIETLGPFVSGEVGEFHSRVGNEPMEIESSGLTQTYADVPVAVLVDEETEAEAEQVAAILQDQGRATIVGRPTSGQTHGANDVAFGDGSLLQIVSFGFQLPDGRTLESTGVTPDVLVDEDWLAYSESEDPVLAAAIDALSAKATPTASPSSSPSSSPSG